MVVEAGEVEGGGGEEEVVEEEGVAVSRMRRRQGGNWWMEGWVQVAAVWPFALVRGGMA